MSALRFYDAFGRVFAESEVNIMNAIQLLRQQLKDAHDNQEATILGVSKTALHFKKTGKALPIGAAYAHSVISEDVILAILLGNKKPLSEGTKNTGLSHPMPSFANWDQHEKWVTTVKIDLPVLQKFAKKVYKATDNYIAGLTEKDLDKEIDVAGFGKRTIATLLGDFIIMHIASVTGEISAVKGMQGLKGYPF
jgi:hypothetical protein